MNIGSRIRYLIVCLIALVACSGLTIPEEKKQYIGDWQSSNVRILITEDGYLHYIKQEGMTTTIDAPLTGFDEDGFSSGIGCIKTKFIVNEKPTEENGRWTMTVDGHKLIRVYPKPTSQVVSSETTSDKKEKDNSNIAVDTQDLTFESKDWQFVFAVPKNLILTNKSMEREENGRKIHQIQYKSEDPKSFYKLWHIRLLSEKTTQSNLYAEIQQLFKDMKVTYYKSRTGKTSSQMPYFEVDYSSLTGMGSIRVIILDEDELLFATHIGEKQETQLFFQSLHVNHSK